MNIKKKILIAIRPIFYKLVQFYIRSIPFEFGKVKLIDNLVTRVSWSNNKTFFANSFFNLKFLCDPKDLIDNRIYFFGIWEPNLSRWILNQLNPGDVFIDIGAHIGYFSSIASKLVGKDGKVVAFEASPQTFKRLKETIDLNNLSNIRVENIAILETEGTVSLFSAQSFNTGAFTILKKPNQISLATVNALPLNKSLTNEEISRARLIKIDVEGAELSVIKSLTPILKYFSKDLEIVVEISPSRLAEQGFSVDLLMEIFEGEGFIPYELKNDYSTKSYVSYISTKNWIYPVKISGPITSQIDVIFSRKNLTS